MFKEITKLGGSLTPREKAMVLLCELEARIDRELGSTALPEEDPLRVVFWEVLVDRLEKVVSYLKMHQPKGETLSPGLKESHLHE